VNACTAVYLIHGRLGLKQTNRRLGKWNKP